MSFNKKDLKTLQIRRPNKLFTKPMKKHLEILFDILSYNFYVKNPHDQEFKISWVELQNFYGVATSNKEFVKESLYKLQDENLISDLETWEYGFSYRFENTFIPYDEIKKPEQYTFLDLRIMQQLSALGYKLYILAYKFFDFTRNRKGETKYLEVEVFLKLFKQSFNGKSAIGDVKNRLLTQLRKEISHLKEMFDIDIEILFKKFGRPITHIKLMFHFVPKLKKIISKFVDFKLIPKDKPRKNYSNSEKDENEFQRVAKKREREQKRLEQSARVFAMKKFLTDVYFPKVAQTTSKAFESVREWIKKNYPDYELNSLEEAEHHFRYFRDKFGFYKAFQHGVLTEEDFDITRTDGNRVQAKVIAKHPVLPDIEVVLPIISMW